MKPIALTGRQREVLTLLARGWTAAEIGVELAISTRTVRAHLDALRLKLGARRCRELPALYRRLSGVDLLAESETARVADRATSLLDLLPQAQTSTRKKNTRR